MNSVERLSESELEKILLTGRIKGYADLSEYNYLVEYYITTGETPEDYETARKSATEIDSVLANTLK